MGTSMESPGNSLGPQSLIRARTRMVLFDHDEEYEVIINYLTCEQVCHEYPPVRLG